MTDMTPEEIRRRYEGHFYLWPEEVEWTETEPLHRSAMRRIHLRSTAEQRYREAEGQ